MTDEKLTEHRPHSLLSKRLSIPDPHRQHFTKNETPHSFIPSSIHKQPKTYSPAPSLINMNPLTALNYNSIFRPISFDASQPLMNNHYDSINASSLNQSIESKSFSYPSGQSSHLLEDTTVLKINIPIEMIVRNLPQQFLTSAPEQQFSAAPHEQYDHRHTYSGSSWSPKQNSASDWSSKSGTSFLRKAQEALFGANMHNDRGDVSPKLARRADLPASDSRTVNEMNKSVAHQQQQYIIKPSQKPFQALPHQSIISQCSDSSSYSCPKRCQCGSTLYSSM